MQNNQIIGNRNTAHSGISTDQAPDILESFARQAARVPDKAAIEFEGSALTYRELDRFTNRIARLLRSRGVVESSRVAVAMPRGLGEFSTFIAVLKAGGAYVPIDISHPVDRIRLVLEDAEPEALVAPSDSPLRGSLPDGLPFVALDDPFAADLGFSDEAVDARCEPGRIAYILFTSGSTGRPKGVAIPRGGISNFIHSAAKEPGIAESDRLAAISTSTFDMSELDLFLPLQAGATVVIADRMTALDPARLRSFLDENRISVMQATPTTWRMLLDAGWKGGPKFRAFTGGEAISPGLAGRLLERCSELWNLYGPTETSVYSTIERIRSVPERMTVGGPIENTLISLRDEGGSIVPDGEVGEICIGGRGLAIGYYGRPELTAERFPTDPATGERYYRTGDLGRWLPEGKLECLGRMDNQVKIRGFRIEPSDIESQLRSAPGVSDVIVVGLKREEGDPILAAYWIGTASREDLYRRAKESLPPYMVPSAYVRMEDFPVTTTGKVDRKRLPSPQDAQRVEEAAGTAPRNDKESIVAAVWREALGLSFVPVDADFFSLGGSSVRAVQVQAKLGEALGMDFPLRSLYEHPTIEGLVAHLGTPADREAPIVSQLAKGADPVPWFGLMGIQLFEDIGRAFKGSYSLLGIHAPVYYVPGEESFPSVEELARKYIAAIKERQPRGPYYLLGLCLGGVVAFEAAAQLEERGEEVALVVMLDAELPRARRTILARRIGHELRELARDPGATIARAAGKVSGRLGLGKRAARAATGSGEATAESRRVEIDMNDPALDGDLARYQELGRKVGCEVLALRATKSDLAPWLAVAEDMGWTGMAGKLVCRDIAANHLGIVRAPHASEVAGLMIEARRRIEAGR